ncbi:hypothetical protein NEOKW01_0604 [Nematocida sp. AWRm80]|nr:hypothetical protein NEOKW01_0604 [Nematocida sp. AWRm80]
MSRLRIISKQQKNLTVTETGCLAFPFTVCGYGIKIENSPAVKPLNITIEVYTKSELEWMLTKVFELPETTITEETRPEIEKILLPYVTDPSELEKLSPLYFTDIGEEYPDWACFQAYIQQLLIQ